MFTDCCTLSILAMPQEQETLDDLTRSRRAALSPAQYNAESPIKDNFSTFSEDGIPVVSRQIAKSVHISYPSRYRSPLSCASPHLLLPAGSTRGSARTGLGSGCTTPGGSTGARTRSGTTRAWWCSTPRTRPSGHTTGQGYTGENSRSKYKSV